VHFLNKTLQHFVRSHFPFSLPFCDILPSLKTQLLHQGTNGLKKLLPSEWEAGLPLIVANLQMHMLAYLSLTLLTARDVIVTKFSQ
jgi:hypothetical protein